VCKHNLELLAKNGPHFCQKFLQGLVTSSKQKDDATQASKVDVSILQKEASRKQWRQVNRTTCKAWEGLTVAVKVPTADGVCEEFKIQYGVFQAVRATLVDMFQLALVAHCRCGTFFEDVGHLADGPAAQKILEGT
jgi:hypothetical protein